MMDTDILSTLTASAMTSYAIQWLKKSPSFDWLINDSSKYAPVILSAGAAALASAGIHWEYNDSIDTLTITGINTLSAIHFAWDFIKSFVSNQFVYHKFIKDNTANEPGK